MTTAPNTVLVSMPWAPLKLPSIQLGTLTSVLKRADLPVTPLSLFVEFMHAVWDATETAPADARLTARDYIVISEMSWANGFGDWLFALPPFPQTSQEMRDAYAARIVAESPALYELGLAFQRHVPAFIERAAGLVLAANPDIVGFTSTFNQNVPSIHLAMVLKRMKPGLVTLFGGANCDGPMGAALLETFDAIDYTFRGEAEHGLPEFVRCIGRGGDPGAIGGLSYRRGGTTVSVPAGRRVTMDDVPMPEYDEYFARTARSEHRSRIDRVMLPIETSRGCWWGEKHHCTFCGLNGSTLAFRSKAPDVAVAEFEELSSRYKSVSFQAVDNILDLRYFATVLPQLKRARERGHDYTVFYETKANLRKQQLRDLHDSGVTWIQPGIESLSTPILRLMDKGVTALQNIRLLKWAAEYDIEVSWNLLHGFPGELPEHYAAMAELIPSLTHLPAPGMSRLFLERFSPYFEESSRYGIEVLGPATFYRFVYPASPDALARLAYDFEYTVPSLAAEEYIAPVSDLLVQLWPKTTRGRRTLRFRRGPGFLVIEDRRAGLPVQDLVLSGSAALVYLACDAGATVPALLRALAASDHPLDEDELRAFLRKLIALRMMYEEDGVYLALALALRPVVENDLSGNVDLLRSKRNGLSAEVAVPA